MEEKKDEAEMSQTGRHCSLQLILQNSNNRLIKRKPTKYERRNGRMDDMKSDARMRHAVELCLVTLLEITLMKGTVKLEQWDLLMGYL